MNNEPKNERIRERSFPFTYDGWDEAGGYYGDTQFYDVEFIEDFGPIKKGGKFDCVVIYHSEAKLVTIINDPSDETIEFAPQVGEIVVHFRVIPV